MHSFAFLRGNFEHKASFNAGVLVLSLRRWRRANATDAIARWVAANRRDGLWRHGSQPPLLLRFAAEALPLSPVWNLEGLGTRPIPAADIASAKILHWSGPRKPWHADALQAEPWQAYARHCWAGTALDARLSPRIPATDKLAGR